MTKSANTANTGFRFGSKAATLAALKGQLTKGRILPLVRFTLQEWQDRRDAVLGNIVAVLGNGMLIVRSSSLAEDTESDSGAGCFCSVANVWGRKRLTESVDEVIASYRGRSPKDEVLVQPMAEHVVASGVAMTRTPESGLPYYVINYTEGNDTAAVTGGDQHVMAHTAYKHAAVDTPPVLAGLIEALREIERVTGSSTLDIEFAMVAAGPLILQVRPMTAIGNTQQARFEEPELEVLLQREMARIDAELIRVAKAEPTPQALYGIMPDWNPAEMIGVKPRPLAYSCYQNLITDVNWASARFRYGYRDMRNQPLMTLIGGTPYISIPRSIESFIPAALPQSTANSISAACCAHLAQHRHLHDKLEFSVIPTCYVPTLESESSPFNALMQALSNEQKIQYIAELKHVSEHIISHDGPFFTDLQLVARIERRVEELKRVPDDGLHAFRQAIGAANICGELFAGAARAGFTATALLKSIEQEGNVDAGLTDCMIGGVETVGKDVASDFIRLTRAEFLVKHGHIRPGTYDIRVRRYDEDPESYFDWNRNIDVENLHIRKPSISRRSIAGIGKTFRAANFDVNSEQFLHFVVAAVAAREKMKYLYAALVSEALKRLTSWGKALELGTDALSYLVLEDLNDANVHSVNRLQDLIDERRSSWEKTSALRTPELICESKDLVSFGSAMVQPNFITANVAESRVRVLAPDTEHREELSGKIVLIENADPGFDWIFTRQIAGFITAYGGENSHMSIRAREFSMPAAIGVGDQMFRALSQAARVRLDCSTRKIQILQ